MTATLLRRAHLLSWLVLLLTLLGGARPALASHLLGGEMTYKYLNATGPTATPYRYEITLTIYTNCNSSVTAPTAASIYIYNQATGALLASPSVARTFISPTCVTVPVPLGCTNTGATQQPFKVNRYVATVSLPTATNGYYAYFTSGNRNAGIANIASPDYEYLTLYATLARPALANNSPVFATDALAVLCAADTTVVLNNAVDVDGDRLEYSLVTPYSASTYPTTFTLPLTTVTYNPTYSNIRPLGASPNSAKIDASSGISKFYATSTGAQYAVAIDVKEYRTIGGVETLIGTTRRDVQLIVGSCPPTMPPVLPTSAMMPRSYTIEAGSTLSIPITATQPDNHPLTLMASSTLLDGAGGYVATFGGSAGTPVYTGSPLGTYTVAGTTNGTVSGTFVFTPACTDARSTPYDVTLLVNDVGCAGKLRSEVLRITVVKPTGPTNIAGSLAVCGLGTTQAYTATGGTAPRVAWTVTGGTIVGSATANPVQVQWPTAGAGTLTAQGVTQYGCLVDVVTKNVTISPAATLTAAGNLTICQGSSTSISIAGGTAPYLLTGGAAPATGAGPFVLSPSQTTTYTVTNAVAPASGCPPTGQFTITVTQPPVAAAGAAVALCAGGTGQLGAAPVAGTTYSWSPATGLNSSTVANPTVTLANTTGNPITQTYTLTATNAAGCQASSPVVVTVAPQPVAVPGAAVAFCSGSSASLGAAPVAGLTYSWSPATGLSNATSANPTVTLTNATGTSIIQTYTLTVATSGCTSTGTVAVTVSPAPVAAAGAAVALCSGSAGQLGAAAVSGNTYSWSPATGLSSATSANPTVTLTNTTGAPITQTYTLTTTNTAGCSATSTVAVVVSPAPVATAGAARAFCSGSSAVLGTAPVAGLTYSWSPAAGLSSSTSANPSVTLTNATGAPRTQTYTLTVTSSGGCASTSTVTVTVNPLPAANAGAAAAFCAGNSAVLGAAPVAGLTYSWSPATGLSSSTVANPLVTLPNATSAPITQTYTLTATSAAGCTSTSTVAVTVSPLPTAVPGAVVAFCSGGSASLGAAPASGLSYSWSPATGLTSATSANPTVTLTNTTGTPITQTYTLTATNAAGCTSTGTVAVTVNPLPIANAGAAVALCAGGTGQLGAAPVAGHTYSWSPTTGLSSSTTANPSVTLPNATSAPIAQTYTLTVTANGCTSTGTVAVTVNPLPVANAGAAVAFCTGGTGQLGTAPVAGLSYSWSPATGLSSATSADPTVTLPNATSAPITQTYTLTATSAAGCTSTSTVAVTVSPQPLAVAGATLTRCSGNAAQLGAAPVAGHTYSWSPATGLSSSTVANPTVTLTNTTGTTATHTYTLTVTNAGGCASTGTVAVTVLPALSPGSIGADQTVCAGSLPAPLTSLAAASGGPGTLAYQWESSADNLTWTALANVTTLACAPGPVAATTYFRRRVVASCGTAYSNVVTVTTQPLLLPAVALPVLPAQCAGTAFTFTPVPTNAGSSPTYQWFVNGTAVGTGPGYTSSTLRDGDVVRVVLTPTVGFCASGPAIATARVSLTPVLISSVKIAATTSLPACPGEVVAFGIDAVANIGISPQYQWQVDGVSVAGATGPRFSSRTLRDGQAVTLVVRSTDACGQPATATSGPVRVALNQPVALSAGPDKTITEGESVVLEGTASGSASVVWSPTQTLTFASGDRLRPTAAPLATTTYTLSAGAGGCASTSTVTVTVMPRLRIPNAFSPNGDNNDDSWQIDNIEAYPNSRVVVFNRWGTKIFEAANYSRGSEWRGTINGQAVPFGTYYYLITLGNGKSFTGPLTVIN